MYQLILKSDQGSILFDTEYKIKDSFPYHIVYMYIKIIIQFSFIFAFYLLYIYPIVDISTTLVTLEEKGCVVGYPFFRPCFPKYIRIS